MKRMKRLISILLTMLLVLGVSGCMNEKGYSSEDIKDEMIAHMDKKYGKEFVSISLSQAGFECSYDKLSCYVKGTDKYTDNCTVCRKYNKEKGKYYYDDDYFGVQIRDDYENLIKGIVAKYAGDYKFVVFTDLTGSSFPNKYDKNSTLNDALNDGIICSYVKIVFFCGENDKAKYNEIVNSIFNELSEKKLKRTFDFYFMKLEVMNNINRNNYYDILLPDSKDCYYYVHKRYV